MPDQQTIRALRDAALPADSVLDATDDQRGTQVVFSLDRMKGVDLNLCKRSVRGDAGLRLPALNDKLAEHGLFFRLIWALIQ